jgi:serine protease
LTSLRKACLAFLVVFTTFWVGTSRAFADQTASASQQLRPVELSASPNDPLFPVTASPDSHQWGLHSLKLPEAWDYNKGHAYVGVIDAGIDTRHPDLKTYNFDAGGNLLSIGPYRRQFAKDYGYGEECTAAPGVDCFGAPSRGCVDEGQPQIEAGACRAVDFAGHGTHVAGLVAATTNNATGVAGTCWNCSLMISKTSRLRSTSRGWENTENSEASVVAAIEGAVMKGAQVLNLSFGYQDSPPSCAAEPTHSLCEAITFARNRDVVLVAASGNELLPTLNFPAADPRIIAVGGIETDGSLWSDCPGPECGTNFSRQQLVAPAQQILSTFYRGLDYFGSGTECPGFDPFGICRGTSMAAPQVAGAAGLLRSINPLLKADNIAYLLRSNLDNPAGWNAAYGYGKPHVANAAKAALGKSGGVQLPNRLTPLFSLYSSVAEDFMYTTVPQMASAAHLSAAGYVGSGPIVPGYSEFPGACTFGPCPVLPAASVYLLTGDRAPFAGAPPLVPLYRLTYEGPNPNGNSRHRDSTYTTELAGVQAYHSTGYEVDGIEGYLFKKCTPEPSCMPAGTVRLLRRYHPQRDDHAIFPENELAQFQAAGYSASSGSDVIGYVYPRTDSDGDLLIDGFERLAGTNPAVADSDCDGTSDGIELLRFGSSGYGDPLQGNGCAAPPAVQFVAQTVPTTMQALRAYNVSITVKNVGTTTWSPVNSGCGSFVLGSANPQNNSTWGRSRAALPVALPPGGVQNLIFSVTAPAAAGSYNFQWQMLQECGAFFGQPSPNVVVTVLAPPQKAAQVLSVTQPSQVRAGQAYSLSFTLRNTGTTIWNPVGAGSCGSFRLGSRNPIDNVDGAPSSRFELPWGVAPGGQVTVGLTATAPRTPGAYGGQLQMVHECVEWFGDLATVGPIQVVP